MGRRLFRTPGQLAAWLALLLILTSCGGGSSGPTAPGGVTIPEVESRSFALVNDSRRSDGVGSDLMSDPMIAEVARRHSEAMRDQGFFSHTDPAGNGLRSRLRSAGIQFRSAGENLAQVNHPVDPAGMAHQEFMASQIHRRHILNAEFKNIGVGVARSGDTYWITQIFVEN